VIGGERDRRSEVGLGGESQSGSQVGGSASLFISITH
jgi:hypothetical protein